MTFIRKQDRTNDAVMILGLLSPHDIQKSPVGGNARRAALAAISAGALRFVAVSTGRYPNWINSANLD